jgi:hypothetical protein
MTMGLAQGCFKQGWAFTMIVIFLLFLKTRDIQTIQKFGLYYSWG